MERRLHLSTETAGVYLSWQGTGFDDYPKADPSNGGRVQREFAGAERAATSMAARSVKRGRGVVRGRTAIAIGLGAFLVVTTSGPSLTVGATHARRLTAAGRAR